MEQMIINQANMAVRNTIPYQAGKPIEEVKRELGLDDVTKLASNENPLGSSSMALQAIRDVLLETNIYPDASYCRLRQAIATYNSIDMNLVTVGNGSENCLDFLMKIFLDDQSNIIIDQYCFAAIQIIAKGYGAGLIKVPSINYRQDIATTIKSVTPQTKMIFVVNPNNPTGTYATSTELNNLLEQVPNHVIVVVDEAYYEYVDKPDYPKTLELISKYPNLVISRSFSKVFGLAGMRLGYLITSPTVADLLHRARLPFNVNNFAVAAGIAALTDHEFLNRTKQVNAEGLLQLTSGFAAMGVEYIPSVANFVTINTKRDGVDVFNQLLQKGLIVRPLVPYGLLQHLRITIGTYEQNELILAAVREVLHV